MRNICAPVRFSLEIIWQVWVLRDFDVFHFLLICKLQFSADNTQSVPVSHNSRFFACLYFVCQKVLKPSMKTEKELKSNLLLRTQNDIIHPVQSICLGRRCLGVVHHADWLKRGYPSAVLFCTNVIHPTIWSQPLSWTTIKRLGQPNLKWYFEEMVHSGAHKTTSIEQTTAGSFWHQSFKTGLHSVGISNKSHSSRMKLCTCYDICSCFCPNKSGFPFNSKPA